LADLVDDSLSNAVDGTAVPPCRSSAVLMVAVVSALAQLPTFNRTIVSLDEGQLTAIGHRLAAGEVLYRDIYTGIFPGIYWLAEALFRALGTDVLVLRWTQLVVNAVTAALLFTLVRPLAPGLTAWLVPVGYWALVVASFPAFTMLSYSSLSLVSALAALVCVRRYVEGARVLDGVAAGVLLGVCTLFKQNFGAIALLAVFLSALWSRREGRLAQTPAWRAFGVPIVAGAAVALVAALRLAASGAWPKFIEATFLTIFASQVDAFNQPLPPVFGPHPGGPFVFFYGPGAMFGAMMRGDPLASPSMISWAVRLGYGSAYLALALVPLLALRVAHGAGRAPVRIAARVVLPFSALFFLGIFPSAIWSHLAAVYPPLLMVLAASAALALAGLRRASPPVAVLARRAGFLVLAVLVALAARLEFGTRSAFAEPLMLPAATVRVSRREAGLYRAAADFLTNCAAEGEPVFVAPDMPLLYASTGRPNPTPYDLIIPGDVRESVILERLKSSNVSCIVFNPSMYVQFAPFEKLFPGLAAYLGTQFRTVRVHKVEGAEWRFLRRIRDEKAGSPS
jgi:hypothetical protein